jgi:glutaredoxin
MMRRALVVCLALFSAVVAAQTYRYVDPSGRTIISDSPPPGRARDVSKTVGGVEEPGVPYSVKLAAANFPVTLYTSADCTTQCADGRNLLNGRGVPFTEKMLQKEEDVAELKQLVGDAFVPALKVGKQSFRGFEAGAWNNLLDLAGYPKSAPYGSKPAGGLAK